MIVVKTILKNCVVVLAGVAALVGCTSLEGPSNAFGVPAAAAPKASTGAAAFAAGFPWGVQVKAQHLSEAACAVGDKCPKLCEQQELPYYCGYACAESAERCELKHADVLPRIAWFSPATGKLQPGERWSPDQAAGQLPLYASFRELTQHPVPDDLKDRYDVGHLPSMSVGHELLLELGVRLPANGPKKVFADVGIVAPAYLFEAERAERAPSDGCLVATVALERTGEVQESVLETVRALIPPGCAKLAGANAPLNFAVRFRVPGYAQIEAQTVTFAHGSENFAAQLADNPVLGDTVFRAGNPCYRDSCPAFALLSGTVGEPEAEYNPSDFPKADDKANYLSLFLDPDPLKNAEGSVAIRTGNDGKDFCKEIVRGTESPLFTVGGVMVALGYGGEALDGQGAPLEVSFGADPVELHYELCPNAEKPGEDCITIPFKGNPGEADGMVCLTAEGARTDITEPDECLRHKGHVWRAEDASAHPVASLKKGYMNEGTRFRHQLFLNGEGDACEQVLDRGWHDGRALSLRLCATRPRLGFFNDQTLGYQKQICSNTAVSLASDEVAVQESYGASDSIVDESKLSGYLGSLFVTTASVGPRQVQTFTRASSWIEPTPKNSRTMAALFYEKAKDRPVKGDTAHPESLADALEQGVSGLKLYGALVTGWALPFVDIAGSVYTGTKRLGDTPDFKDRKGESDEKQQSMRFYYGALGYLDMALDWQGDADESVEWGKILELDLVSIFGGMDDNGMNAACLNWHLWSVGYPGSVAVCPWVKIGAYVNMDLDSASGEPDPESFFPEAYHSGRYKFDFGASVGAGVTLKLSGLDVFVLRAGVAGELTALKVKWGERTGMHWGIWDGQMHVHPLETTAGGAGSIRYLDGRAYAYLESSFISLWQLDLWSFQGGGHEWEHVAAKAPDKVIE